MRFAKTILAAAAMATAIAPVASFAGDVRPGNSLVSASAAAASPAPVAPTQRAGAEMSSANSLIPGYWVAIVIAVGVTIWVFVKVVNPNDEPEVISP